MTTSRPPMTAMTIRPALSVRSWTTTDNSGTGPVVAASASPIPPSIGAILPQSKLDRAIGRCYNGLHSTARPNRRGDDADRARERRGAVLRRHRRGLPAGPEPRVRRRLPQLGDAGPLLLAALPGHHLELPRLPALGGAGRPGRLQRGAARRGPLRPGAAP